MEADKVIADLTAIMDLLAKWREENDVGYVTMSIDADGTGWAYSLDETENNYETEIKHYKAKETLGAATPRESK